MTTWVTSDLHFGHHNILKYCDRPFADAEEMNEVLIQEFVDNVKDDDHVYHLGDFMFGIPSLDRFYMFFNRMPGKWHFILGNHDIKSIKRNQDELIKHERIVEIVNDKVVEHDGELISMYHHEQKEDVWASCHYHFFGHSHSPSSFVRKPYRRDVGIDGSDWKLRDIDWHLENTQKNI